MNTTNGIIAQVLGPVVDVKFPGGKLPAIREALDITVGGQRQVLEVAQHIRCV